MNLYFRKALVSLMTAGAVLLTGTALSFPVKAYQSISVDVNADTNFYFSHDPNAFDEVDLIVNAVDRDGGTVDYSHFSFGLQDDEPDPNLSPRRVYEYYQANATAEGYKYDVAKPLYIFYNSETVLNDIGEPAIVYVYIGVKGDTNLDGSANTADAEKLLIYAAAAGAGDRPTLCSDYNEILENFVYFLADTDTESKDGYQKDGQLTALDAANVLLYAALAGARGSDNAHWIDEVNDGNGILSSPYPEVSWRIAEASGLIR